MPRRSGFKTSALSTQIEPSTLPLAGFVPAIHAFFCNAALDEDVGAYRLDPGHPWTRGSSPREEM